MEVNKMPEEKGIMYELLNVDADKASEEKFRAWWSICKARCVMYMFIGWGIGEEEIRPAAQEMGNLLLRLNLIE